MELPLPHSHGTAVQYIDDRILQRDKIEHGRANQNSSEYLTDDDWNWPSANRSKQRAQKSSNAQEDEGFHRARLRAE